MPFCRIWLEVAQIYYVCHNKMSHNMTKPRKWVFQAKTQISLDIWPVWSKSLLFAQWVTIAPSFLCVDSKDSGHTYLMPRLVWFFSWGTATFLVSSCRNITLNASIATKVVCFSHLLKCLRSLYGKPCGPRSDCSYSSSLFWVHAVCF